MARKMADSGMQVSPHIRNEFSLRVRVYYDDTDATGVMYHANYLRYFERARTDWLRQFGYGQEELRTRHNVAFTIVSIDVRYRFAARLDDELDVTAKLTKLKRASFIFAQRMARPDNGEVMATAVARAACISADDFAPLALPQEMHRIMQGVLNAD